MSLQQFQAALAYVIRVLEPNNRQDIAQILSQYDLSHDEQQLLLRMAEHRLVKAYADDMLTARWRIINGAIDCLYAIVPKERFKQIWREGFEPNNAGIAFLDVNTKFIDYLIHDIYARDFITKDAPPYLLDMLKYLFSVFLFSKNVRPPSSPPPEGSLLEHGCFKIVHFDYDVREACEELLVNKDIKNEGTYMAVAEPSSKDGTEGPAYVKITPEKAPLIFLFVLGENPTEFRSFEIDWELRTFLVTQMEDPRSCVKLPPCYQDLVDLGLCRTIPSE